MLAQTEFLLYGATGYTAGLIVEQAARFELVPILAGRNELTIRALAEKHGLAYRIADLQDTTALDAALSGLPVVLNCAGPFSKTALPMQQACLRTGVDYLDITGEVAVFEQGRTLHQQALARNVMLMSGVGFDVVPTDCLALYLKTKLPDATQLQLAFANVGGSISHGTAQTAVENLGLGGLIREKGQLKKVPTAYKTIDVAFASGQILPCMSIPWGDVSTAYHTTGIPTIETFIAVSAGQIFVAKLSNALTGLLGSKPVQQFLRKRVSQVLTGPDQPARQKAHTLVWGQVRNEKGQTVTARMRCPEAYTLTVLMALTILQKRFNGQRSPGFQTPAGLYGADLILSIAGVTREDVYL